MDEKLQRIFRIRPLQEEVITYRNNMKLYRTLMKETCMAELKKLMNVKINVSQVELKLPDAKQLPPNSELCPGQEAILDALIRDADVTFKAIELL